MKPSESSDQSKKSPQNSGKWLLLTMAVILLIFAVPMTVGGLLLIFLAGSWYYLLAGSLLLGSAMMLLRRSVQAVWLYLSCYLFTWIWAVWEVGFSVWPLMPRVLPFTVLLIPVLFCMPIQHKPLRW